MRLCVLFASLLAISFSSCTSSENADMIVYNATIYTVDDSFSMAEAMAIKDGKILETGSTTEINSRYTAKEMIDANGKFIYPGFIDAHAHFFGYAADLSQASFTGANSWSECLQRLKEFQTSKNIAKGEWLLGNGWDQNDWDNKEFPDRDSLDKYFPDNPVLLTRVDGHAAIANGAALQQAGITPGTTLTGGAVEVVNGRMTGILIDNAIGLVSRQIPSRTEEQITSALMEAQQNCFAKGLTTIDDCGISFSDVELLDKLHKNNQLKMRIYALLSDDAANYDYIAKKGKIKTDRLNVRGFKVYSDGALGSRGACLLHPYSDKPGHHGFLLSDASHFDSVANILYQQDLQMCTHAIGDSGNRTVLNIYGKYLGGKNDKRWRIEHAQIVDAADMAKFGQYSVVPSVQPTHATSDMYWAPDRLGNVRVHQAYAFKQLLDQNGWIPLGTDFPVEDIDPLKTFYAAVIRKDSKGWPENGFQMNDALSREEALRGMTIWAARSNFEEQEKGSLEKGKLADFVLLDQDLMKADEGEILNLRVMMTVINGEKVYQP